MRSSGGGGGRNRRGPGGGGSKSDEELLIALMRLVREGHPGAAAIRAKFQEDGDQQAFLNAARGLLASPGGGGDSPAVVPGPSAILNGGNEGSREGNPPLALPTAALGGLGLGGVGGSGGFEAGDGSARLSQVLGGGFGGLTVDAGGAKAPPPPQQQQQQQQQQQLSSPLQQGQAGGMPPGLAPIGSPRQQQPSQQQPQQLETQPQQQQQQQQGGGGQSPPPPQLPPGGAGGPMMPPPPFGGPGGFGGFPPPFMGMGQGMPGGPRPGMPPPPYGMSPLPSIPLHLLHSLQPSQIPPYLLGPGGLLPPGMVPPPPGAGAGGMMPPHMMQQPQQPQQPQDGEKAGASPSLGGAAPPGSPPPSSSSPTLSSPPPPPQQQQQEQRQQQHDGSPQQAPFPGGLGGLGGPPHPLPPGGMPSHHGFPPFFPPGPFMPPGGMPPGWMGPGPFSMPQQPPPQGSTEGEVQEQKEDSVAASSAQQQKQAEQQRQRMMQQQQQQQQQQQFLVHQHIMMQQHGHSMLMMQQALGQQQQQQPGPGGMHGQLQQHQQQSPPLQGSGEGNGGAFSPLEQQLQAMLNLSKEAATQEQGGAADAPLADGNGGAAATPTAAAKQPPKRTARNQQGRLWVLDGFSRQPVAVVRPKGDLLVQWEAPLSVLQPMAKPDIALFRLGVASNQNAIVTKSVNVPRLPPVGEEDLGEAAQQMAQGQITFFAPRSAGTFVFRLFDAADPVATHATSRRFRVEVHGVRDVEGNLRLILGQLRERKTLVAGLSQLHLLLRDLRPFQYRRNTFPTLLWDALSEAVTQLGGEQSVADKDERGRSKYPVQSAVALILQAAMANHFVQACLDARQRAAVRAAENLWCPLAEEFFESEAAKQEYRQEHFGLQPVDAPLAAIPQQVGLALTQAMEALLPSLLPSDTFLARREEVRARVEAMLPALASVFPPGTRLRVFGSSANNFGSDAADLDMCVTFPADAPAPEASPGEMIEALAAHLEAQGMAEVTPRPTARIPIVLFVDPRTGLDCDISVENPLALRNTQLLHAYSLCDPRVRALAYAVKHWARRRKVNNASEGTLSSYGYVLLVIHFLQTRRPHPVLPSLQRLPPAWDGEALPTPTDSNAPTNQPLPQTLVRHSIEKDLEVDTYFYSPPPTPDGLAPLRRFGARNPAPLGALLVEFFRYYAWEFDYREHVVSVRTGGVLRKEDKAEDECWPVNARLAIEDPFEVFYNVAHFIREGRHRHIRAEYARAYTLCCEEAARVAAGGLPQGEALLERLVEEAPDPPPPRKNTMEEVVAMAGGNGGDGGGGGDSEEGPAPALEAVA